MAKKKSIKKKMFSRATNATVPDKKDTPAITITKTLGQCPVCGAKSLNINRYMIGDIFLFSTETTHQYDIIQVEEKVSPRRYYKDGIEHTCHRMVANCVCSLCDSTWYEDYDTAIPTEVYGISDNSKRADGPAVAFEFLGAVSDEAQADAWEEGYDYVSQRHGIGQTTVAATPLEPYIADPTPLYLETSITKTTTKGDKE